MFPERITVRALAPPTYPHANPHFLRYNQEVLGLKAKAGLLFFVSAGIFIALVAFGNFIAPKKIAAVPDKNAASQTAQTIDALQETIGSSANAFGNSSPAETATPAPDAPATTPSDTSNLTQTLAALIGKSIVDKNPEGPAGESLSVTGADAMVDEALAESLKRFNPAYFSPALAPSEITVDKSQDPAIYRVAVAQIMQDAESQPMPPASDPVASQMKALAARYANEAGELYALAVPPTLINDHIKLLRTALGKQRILETVADYEADPIYAMLALKLWNTIQ